MTARPVTEETAPPAIDITIEDAGWGEEASLRRAVEVAAMAVFAKLGVAPEPTELSVLFTDDARMATINGQWRNKPKPTNVLSFPAAPIAAGEPAGPLLGDIVLARETIAREATIDGKSVDAHLSHLIVHGILHLLGYDHAQDDEAERMEQLERAILADMGVEDPYAPVSDT